MIYGIFMLKDPRKYQEANMNLQTLAENVRRLRVSKRMSQKDLSESTGISLPAIKNLEGFKTEPRMNTLQAIAKSLEVRFEELFLPVRPMRAVRFRSGKKMQNRENVLARVSKWLDDFNYLEEALNKKAPFKLKEMRPQCSRNQIEKAADLCREKLGLKADEPIHDLCGLLEKAGIKVYQLPLASDGFFGLSIGEEDGGPAIVVNVWDRISVERRIFSAAHELGHLMLHLDAFDVGQSEEDKNEERESDLFAGHFLMPNEGFRKEWNDALGHHWIDRIIKVKRIFSVSYKVVLHRLIELGAGNDSIWRDFQQDFQKRFRRGLSFKEEPFGMKSIDFSEDRYSRLAREAVEEEKISSSRGAAMLGIGIGEMRDLMQNWRMAV